MTRAFYVIFAVCFIFVSVNVIFKNFYHKTEYLVPVTAICLALFCLIYALLGKCEAFLEKNYGRLLIAFAVCLFILEVVMGIALRHDVMFDVGAINDGAVEWVETGTFAGFYDYFYSFPNNLGSMMFLYILLKPLAIIGITDYYAVSVVFLSAILTLTTVLTSLICKRLSGVKAAVFALVIFAVSAQFWVMSAAVYTDELSMLFPVLAYWLYLKSKDANAKRTFLLYLLSAAAIAVGSLIKFTVFITAVAIIIDMVLNARPPKKTVCFAACAVGVTLIAVLCFNLYMYSAHLDKSEADKNNTPILHWVMMGLKGNGLYNPGDYELTRALAPEERNNALMREIGRRVNERGFSGMLELAAQKSAINFGDGTYGIADMLHFDPLNDVKELREWVVDTGEHYSIYSHYATSVHIAVMMFMLLASCVFALSKKERGCERLAPYLAVFGIWLFLLFWETNRRYFSNFAPMIIICGVLGAETVFLQAAKIKAWLYPASPGKAAAPNTHHKKRKKKHRVR